MRIIKQGTFSDGKMSLHFLLISVALFIICLFHDLLPRPLSSIVAVVSGIGSSALLILSLAASKNHDDINYQNKKLGRMIYRVSKALIIITLVWFGFYFALLIGG